MARHTSIDAVASAVEGEPLDLTGMSSPDGAVTLVFSDIEDSTGMNERLGDRLWYDILRDHNAVVRGLAGAHDGTVVKSLGDGFMLAFQSAHAAVRCAIEVEQTLHGRAAGQDGETLKVRIGVHSGFVIADSDDFYGRNVVLAARIADCAVGGEVLVSEVVKQYTASDPGLRFEHRGEFRFKGLHGEHAVHSLLWQSFG
ncbi:MAG: adenylate/guanylate cyclase domain-containing protein [Thermoleophilaceae bacterium]|nr:adenylate/guanylate cyclase domain-containing protein [Thermoleophilaceae bacterium]